MAGRRPKPTRLKKLHGNPGKRRLNSNEPEPRLALPKCPRELSKKARNEWRRIARELYSLGLLSRIDRAALAAYCQAWATWLDAVDQLEQTGKIIKAPSGYPILNPYLSIANQAFGQMKAMLIEFGMTPAARSRVTGTARVPDRENRFLIHFGGRNGGANDDPWAS